MSKNKGKSAEELLQEALVPEEEQPYRVPENWVWVTLGSIAEFVYGKSLPAAQRSNKGYPVFGSNGIVGFHEEFLIEGPVIIVGRKGSHGEVSWFKESGWPIDTTYYVKPLGQIHYQYLYYLLLTINLKKLNRSTAIPGLNREDAYNQKVAIPPLNEQKRIADKVERLLNKINQAKQLIEEAKETFELRRAAILDKAFRGELTSKWRDENIKPISGDNTINFSEYKGVLNNIPDTWCWSKLKDFEGEEQLVLTGPFGTTLSNKDFVESGVPVMTIGCLQDEGINLNKANYITEDKANSLNRYRVKEGDILFSRMATVGRASKVEKSFENCLINYHLMRVRLPKHINVDYFLLVVKGAPSTKLFLKSMNHGMTRDGINTKELLNLPIPFPPIEEQRRIVELFSSLQEKEEEINQKIHFLEFVLNQLKASILSTAFKGELGTNFEVEESYIEELKQLIKS